MQLVIDANILLAAFLKSANTRKLIFSESIELFAPEYFKMEVEKHLNIPICSNDSAFKKQKLVKTHATSELLGILS